MVGLPLEAADSLPEMDRILGQLPKAVKEFMAAYGPHPREVEIFGRELQCSPCDITINRLINKLILVYINLYYR